MTGQFSGFFYGIVLDFLSAAPLGLNALIRMIIGTLTGLLKGAFFLDIFLLPMLLCAGATLVKALILFLLSLMIPVIPSYPLTAPLLWAELALNTLSAPFLFALLKRFSSLLTGRRAA
jgi:rod shape-determining protein MreD